MATMMIDLPDEIAEDFKDFCEDVGLTVSSAFGVFARKTIEGWKIPFEFNIDDEVPSNDLLEAMHEAEEIMKNPRAYPSYKSAAELRAAIMAEPDEDA